MSEAPFGALFFPTTGDSVGSDTEVVRQCPYHKEHERRLVRNESDIQDLWKETNAMKGWVVAGMGAVLLQLALFVANKVGI